MTFRRKLALICLIAGICIAALVTISILRASFIGAAQADLQARGIYSFSITGSRMPCSGNFDIGVAVIYRNREDGPYIGGRLCRPPDWSSAWTWYATFGAL